MSARYPATHRTMLRAALSALAALSLAACGAPAATAPGAPAGSPRRAADPVVLLAPEGLAVPEGAVATVRHSGGRLSPEADAWKAVMAAVGGDAAAAVVVARAPSGTAALFDALHELRPGLVAVAITPAEDPLVIEASADLVVDADYVERAYAAVMAAADLGAKALSLSMGTKPTGSEKAMAAVARAAARQRGLVLVEAAATAAALSTPAASAPTAAPGATVAAAATDSPSAAAPAARTAWATLDPAEALALMESSLGSGGFYLELCAPSGGYAAPAGLRDATKAAEAAATAAGGSGRAVVFPGYDAAVLLAGVVDHVRAAMAGARLGDESSLVASMKKAWPAGSWSLSFYVDAETGVRARNHMLVSAEPYLAGRGFLSSARRGMSDSLRQLQGD